MDEHLNNDNADVTARSSDGSGLDHAARLAYQELRAIAERYFRQQRGDHTLQPTALVHEAFVKLSASADLAWAGREHFLSIAAKAMREILADHARRRRALKRGGHRHRTTLSGLGMSDHPVDALDLDEALTALAEVSARQTEIIQLRFYGGLSVDEVARLLDVSPRTVELDSRMARAWLQRRMDEAARDD